jgi:hypothetical protein
MKRRRMARPRKVKPRIGRSCVDGYEYGPVWGWVQIGRGRRVKELKSQKVDPALACWAKVFGGPPGLGMSETRGRAKARPYNFLLKNEEEKRTAKIGCPTRKSGQAEFIAHKSGDGAAGAVPRAKPLFGGG